MEARKLAKWRETHSESVCQLKLARYRLAHKRDALVERLGDIAVDLVVTGYDVYLADIKIARTPLVAGGTGGGKRGLITELTPAAQERKRFFVANSETVARGMLTCTYPEVWPLDGRQIKRHLDNYLRSLRRHFGDSFEYFWFMEFQKRGAPHIHLFTAGAVHDGLKKQVRHAAGCDRKACGVTISKPVGNEGAKRGSKHNRCRVIYRGVAEEHVVDRWLEAINAMDNDRAVRFCRGGMWEPIYCPDGAARYCAKEVAKTHQTQVPKDYQNVGRFWSHSKGWLKPAPTGHVVATHEEVRERLSITKSDKLFPVLYSGAERHKKQHQPKLL